MVEKSDMMEKIDITDKRNMIENLKERFNSMLKVFEILYVIEGVKPAARIMVKEEEYDGQGSVKRFLEGMGLFIDKADFKVLKADEGSFSNKGEKLPVDDKRKGHYLVYLSTDRELVKKAKELEEAGDHVNLGLALGYPKCCCEFFNRNTQIQENRFNDYILPALDSSKGFIFPFYNNYAARYFDLGLLSHFPCSFHCEESLRIAKRHLSVVEKHSYEHAAVLRGMLKCAVVYTENYGVFLLRDPVIKSNEIRYGSVLGSRDNKLSELLRAGNKIKAMDSHHISIGSQQIKTKNLGFMLFM